MNEVKEKDNFWFIVVGIIVVAIAVMLTVKGSEHGKYESSAKAIAEDSANSAYRK